MIEHCQLYMFIPKVCFGHFCHMDAFSFFFYEKALRVDANTARWL